MHMSNSTLAMRTRVALSPADVVSWDNCQRQYWYERVRRVRVFHPSAESIFSAIVGDTVQSYLMAHSLAMKWEPGEKWVQWWRDAICEQSPIFSGNRTAQDLERMGLALMRQLPKAWARTGLTVLTNAREEPLVRRATSACLGKRGDVTVDLQGQVEVLVKSPDGFVGLLEIAAVHSPHSERFTRRSDLLTGKQLLADDYLSVDLDARVIFVGFWDFIYTRSQTAIAPPRQVRARTESELSEYREKCWWIADDITRERFPRTSRWQFNTPCACCPFAGHCLYNDMNGLDFPIWWGGDPQWDAPRITASVSSDAAASR